MLVCVNATGELLYNTTTSSLNNDHPHSSHSSALPSHTTRWKQTANSADTSLLTISTYEHVHVHCVQVKTLEQKCPHSADITGVGIPLVHHSIPCLYLKTQKRKSQINANYPLLLK